MAESFFHIAKLNLWIAAGILAVLAVSKLAGKRYSSFWKYGLWMFFSLALLIPVRLPDSARLWELKISVPAESAALKSESVPNTETGQNRKTAGTGEAYGSGAPEDAGREEEAQALPQEPPEASAPELFAQPDDGAEPFSYERALRLTAAVWAAVAVLLAVFRLTGGYLAFRRLNRWSTGVLPEETEQIYREACRRCGVFRAPQVVINASVAGPVLAGLRKPRIYLPEDFYSGEELAFVFEHELCHYRRRDLWYKLLLAAVTTVYWFNPALYLMKREAEKDVEYLVDARVAAPKSREEQLKYSRVLLKTAASAHGNRYFLSVGLNDGAADFKRRVRNVMNSRTSRRGLALLLAVAMVFSAGNLLTGCTLDADAADGEQDEAVLTPLPVSSAQREPLPEEKQIDAIDGESLEKMVGVFDAVIRDESVYDPEDPENVWDHLHTLVMKSGAPGENGIEYTELENYAYKKVPEEIMREYLAAIFPQLDEIPEIPESKRILYDEQERIYYLGAFDASETETSIESASVEEDGSCLVNVIYEAPYSPTFQTQHWTMRIVRNTYSSGGGKEPLFAYSLTEVVSGYENWERARQEQRELEEKMDTMEPIFTVFMRGKYQRDTQSDPMAGEYYPEYDAYRWEMIRTACVLMTEEGENGVSITEDGTQKLVPGNVVRAYAHAMFYDTKELPKLPETGVSYDSETDVYRFETFEPGELGEVEIYGSKKDNYGTYTANVTMKSADGSKATVTGCIFELVENTRGKEEGVPDFAFSVRDITYWYENAA